MKDSYGTYDGRIAEPPYKCPRCAELERELAEAREGNRQLGQAHIDASNTLAEAESALTALRQRYAELAPHLDHLYAMYAAGAPRPGGQQVQPPAEAISQPTLRRTVRPIVEAWLASEAALEAEGAMSKRKKHPCICKHGYRTHGLDGMCGADWCSCRGYREQPKPRPKKARREP